MKRMCFGMYFVRMRVRIPLAELFLIRSCARHGLVYKVMLIYNKVSDWVDDDVEYCYQITDEELGMICSLKSDDIYNHLVKSIDVMTPLGATKFIPCIMLGKLEISVQINYQLWSMRDDNNMRDDNSPITRAEFDKLVPNTDYWNIDVRIRYDGKPFVPATQMSLQNICDFLGMSIIGDE